MDKALKKSLKTVHWIFGIYYTVICSLIIWGPFVKMFDRTDIWVGAMPLSQFWIILASLLIVIGMGGHYFAERNVYTKWGETNGE